ncbi:hypothetical protein D9M72_572930 [compost metagenome]
MAIASCSVSKRKSGATGPKVSSLASSISVVAPVSTIGALYCLPSGTDLPRAASFAPLASASSTWRSILSIAASLIIGPIAMPGCVPGPTFIALTRAPSFSAKAS